MNAESIYRRTIYKESISKENSDNNPKYLPVLQVEENIPT